MTRPGHLPGLDPLRAFSAVSVLLFHLIGSGDWAEFPTRFPAAWFRGGWVGVDIFFVISGLVVGQSALARWRAGDDRWPRLRFLRDRAVRILPLYLFTCAVFLLLNRGFFARDDLLWQLASHLLLIHNLWADTAASINMPSWSLGAEFQLYVALALAVGWATRRSPLQLALIGFAVSLLWRTGVVGAFGNSEGAERAFGQHLLYLTPGMLESFCCGLALARWRELGFQPGRIAGLALIATGLCGLSLGSLATDASIDGSIWDSPWQLVFMRSGVTLAATALVAGACCFRAAPPSPRQRLLRHLGDLSYGIYLWHMIVVWTLLALTGLRAAPLFVASLALTLLLAEASWRLIERPAMRLWHTRGS